MRFWERERNKQCAPADVERLVEAIMRPRQLASVQFKFAGVDARLHRIDERSARRTDRRRHTKLLYRHEVKVIKNRALKSYPFAKHGHRLRGACRR